MCRNVILVQTSVYLSIGISISITRCKNDVRINFRIIIKRVVIIVKKCGRCFRIFFAAVDNNHVCFLLNDIEKQVL